MPEALTRDIIAPIKHQVKGLDKILKEYEEMLIEEKILPLVPKKIKNELKILITDEFSDKLIINGKIKKVKVDKAFFEEVGIDGSLIKVADHFSAFCEALMSIEYGIKSFELESAINTLKEKYKNKILYGIDFSKFFDEKFFE